MEARWRKWATEGGSWVLQPWPLPVLFLRVQCDLSLLLLCRACPFVTECVARVGPNRPLSPRVVLVRVFITTSGKLTRTWLTTISPDQEVRASLFSLSSLSWKKQTAEEGAHLSDTASTHSLDCSLRVEKYEHLRILVLMKTAMRTLPFDPGPVYFRNAAQNYFWVCLHLWFFFVCFTCRAFGCCYWSIHFSSMVNYPSQAIRIWQNDRNIKCSDLWLALYHFNQKLAIASPQ